MADAAAQQAEIVDAVFSITCRSLPVDHAFALSTEITKALPWFTDEPLAGLHTVHGAASGAGWQRPEGADAQVQLSRRAKLALRLPAHRVDDAQALIGRTLQIAGHPLRVDRLTVRPLSRITTLFSRSVLFDAADETEFMALATNALAALAIRPGTLLCGLTTPLATATATHQTRSLLLGGLTRAQSLALQRAGLGAGRTLGCGVFIPHKDVADLSARAEPD